MLRPSATLLLLLVSLALSFRFSGNAAPHKIQISDVAKTQDGKAVSRNVLVNQKGMEAVPGTLKVQITYTLRADSNELQITYRATTNKDTVESHRAGRIQSRPS